MSLFNLFFGGFDAAMAATHTEYATRFPPGHWDRQMYDPHGLARALYGPPPHERPPSAAAAAEPYGLTMLSTPAARAADRKRRTELYLTVVDDPAEWEALLCRFEYGSPRDAMVVLFLGTNDVAAHDAYVEWFNKMRPLLSDLCEPALRALFFVVTPGVAAIDGAGSDDDDDDDDGDAGEGAAVNAAGTIDAPGDDDSFVDETVLGISSRGSPFACLDVNDSRHFNNIFLRACAIVMKALEPEAKNIQDERTSTAAAAAAAATAATSCDYLTDDGGDADGAALAAAEAHVTRALETGGVDLQDEDDNDGCLQLLNDGGHVVKKIVPDYDY